MKVLVGIPYFSHVIVLVVTGILGGGQIQCISFGNMGVSLNGGTPKSSIFRGISIINHPFWGTPYFWKHPYVPCQLDSCQDGPTIEADPQSTGEKPVVGSEKLPQHARKRRKSVTAGGERLEMLEGMVGWLGRFQGWSNRGLFSFIGGP